MARWVLVVSLALGCGRLGFDPLQPCDDPICSVDARAAVDGEAIADAGTAGEAQRIITPAAADTTITSAAPLANYGGDVLLHVRGGAVDVAKALVRFEPEAPPGAVVDAAALWLTTAEDAVGQVAVHRVLEPWAEGAGAGALGAASFTRREQLVPWLVPGCGPGSRQSEASAELELDAAGTTHVVALPPSLVQAWLDDPATNHGLALVARQATASARLHAREAGGDGPRLVIDLAP